ncbi:hypothetical protein OEZ85_007919 [Tetradesmus obliquus]|uniref:Uncharacterized protein n=1 Tax=Tetradesmus obliquus TaxID=3088 RepID=A0ABY8TJC9_TETOB|nr:hypothetical protein OEZ85_007919 [Tetradesmus obliquus]
MEQHQDVFSPLSPVAGWTPAPDAPSPEGLVALLGTPRPAAKTAPKKPPHVAKGPAVERAASGSASAESSKANLIAPFRERTSSARAEVAEGSEAWDDDGDEEQQQQQQGQGQQAGAAAGNAEAGEPVVDQTFLTGVGITGELPGDDEEAADAGQQAAEDSFQDPTERLAVALGLQVCQLAHYTHRQPGNPLAAVHRLRHALAHPLVDADAGMQPPQHHTGMTAAALAKQRPRQLLPLPQSIPAALDTRVKAVQGIEAVLTSMRGRLQVLEGTLLQQLQAQSDKLSGVAQAMSHNAAECGEDSGAQADQPAADTAQIGCAED